MAKISFEGIGEKVATFEAKSGLERGKVCKVTAAAEVGGCGAGDRFCGVALGVSEELAAVQVGGFVTVGYSGTVVAGFTKLSADGSGGVKADAAGGTEYLVVDVDTAAKLATVLL